MKSKRNPYVVAGADAEFTRRMQELRRSSAAGRHADKRTRRSRTRSAQRARVMKEWSA